MLVDAAPQPDGAPPTDGDDAPAERDERADGLAAGSAEPQEGRRFEFLPVSFGQLSGYRYRLRAVERALERDPDGPLPEQIPDDVRALHGRRIAVIGYLVPFESERAKTARFMLVSSRDLCCYGATIDINDWIDVTMADGEPIQCVEDIPTTVFGTLEVGERIQDGLVASVYRMAAERVKIGGGF